MKRSIPAKYEDGVFKPLVPPDVAEGQCVTLVLQTAALDAVERIALERGDFFGGR